MKQLNKKGQIGGLQAFVMSVVTIGVVLAIGLYVLSELQGNMKPTTETLSCNTVNTTGCGTAYNATGSIITKLGTAPTWIGLLIVVVFASAVLAYFYVRGK